MKKVVDWVGKGYYNITDRTVGHGVLMCARTVNKEEKKGQIVQAAIRIFAKKGFSETTINDIAQAAGIGKGTVYEYFKNKETIFQEAFHYFMGFLDVDLEEILIGPLSAREKLERVLSLFYGLAKEGGEFVELMFVFWAEGIKDKGGKGILINHMHKFYRSYAEIFTDILLEGMTDGTFRKNINPGNVAALIIASMDGIVFQWVIDKERIDLEEIAKTFTITLMKGILNE